jgi:rubrerythrin
VSVADGILYPIHWLVFRDAWRRGNKLLRFAETEADGGRDLARAAELTDDALLRRLYLRHAEDERRHAELFRRRGKSLLGSLEEQGPSVLDSTWIAPGERGLDDLRVDRETDESLLAFLHLSERAAASRFAVYESVLERDPETRRVFSEILHDEAFHMNYTHAQLRRVCPRKYGVVLFSARAGRLWKGYLRVATAIAAVMGACLLVVQYFVVLPLFALLAKRAARREPIGFHHREPKTASFESQYG